MPSYHFITHWKARGTCAEVHDTLSDAEGRLPYTLRWNFIVAEKRKPHGFTINAFGDFLGRGVWILEQDGDDCSVTFDWKLEAEKPLLRKLSFLLRPIFSFNHRWAMEKGEMSLKLELLTDVTHNDNTPLTFRLAECLSPLKRGFTSPIFPS